MKPIQSSVAEPAGDLLPAFAVKGDAAPGESFQAALALALQGVGRVAAAAQVKAPQSMPEPATPAEPTPSAAPAAVDPVVSHPAVPITPPVTRSPAPQAGTKPEAAIGEAAIGKIGMGKAAIEKEAFEPKRGVEADARPANDPADATPIAAPAPPAVVPPAVVPLVVVPLVVAQSLVPTVAPEDRPVARGDDGVTSEPKLRTRTPDTPHAAKPAAMPPHARPIPSAEPREPFRHVDPEDALSVEPPLERQPAARTENPPVAARVTVEEVNVEGRVAVAPPPVKDRKLQRDVEAVEHIADSPAGAPRPEGLPAQSQRVAQEGPAAAPDAPAQLRHDEAPANAGTMDRVTLHLPDDAGGGRIQIAVRGDVVHARIVTPDEVGTREMEAGLDELRGALSRQGFQEAHLRVESRPAGDIGWMPASAARDAAAAGDSRPHDSERQDRQGRDQRQPEDSRSDPRRQHPDGRSHQRSRRERER